MVDVVATMHLHAMECEINSICDMALEEQLALPEHKASFGEKVAKVIKTLVDKVLGAIRWICDKIAKARAALRAWWAKIRNKKKGSDSEEPSSSGPAALPGKSGSDAVARIAGRAAAPALPAHKSDYTPNKQFGPEAPGQRKEPARPAAKPDDKAAIAAAQKKKAEEKAEKARQDAKKNHSDKVHERRQSIKTKQQDQMLRYWDERDGSDEDLGRILKKLADVDKVVSSIPSVANLATMDEHELERVADLYDQINERITEFRHKGEDIIDELKNKSGKLSNGPKMAAMITRVLTELDNSEKIYRQMEKEMRAAASKFHAFDSVKSKSKIALSNQANKAGFSKEGGGGDTGRYKAFITATNKALNAIMGGIQFTSKMTSIITNLAS